MDNINAKKYKKLERRVKELEKALLSTSGAVISIALAIRASKYESIFDKETRSALHKQIVGIMKWAEKMADTEPKTKPN